VKISPFLYFIHFARAAKDVGTRLFGVKSGRFGCKKVPFGAQSRINLPKFDHDFEGVLLILNGLSAISALWAAEITASFNFPPRTGRAGAGE
jgi:hypothetical protein